MTNGVFPVPALQVRRLTEAAYLDTERTPYYRLIMRFFLEQAEAQVTWVKADDILAHVRRAYDPLYDEAQRDRDLKFLAEKRNLLAVQDTRGARTAREFRNRKLEYHIRADALRLERFVRDLERNPAQGGSLDPSLLERLWTRLSELHGLLQEVPLGAEGVNSARAEALWPLWEDAHGYVDALDKNTTAFHQALAEHRPTDITDLTAFDFYKNVLFTNLAGFIVQLSEVADRVQARLGEWHEEGALEVLARHLAYHRAHRLVSATAEDTAQVDAWATRQVRFVADWFRPDGTCDRVRSATRTAINTIGRHLQRLSERESAGQSRAQELRDLAIAFSRVPDLAGAHQLAIATFGVYWHRHHRMVGEQGGLRDGLSVWQQPPTVVPIKPIRQGGIWHHRDVSGVEDVSRTQRALLEAADQARVEEGALWNTVFTAGSLDLGVLPVLPAATRDRLLGVLRECLSAEALSTLALDGSRVTLSEPRVSAPGTLRADDGTLWTPRFRLTRMDVPPAASSGAATKPDGRVAGEGEPVADGQPVEALA